MAHILLAEDNPSMRQFLGGALRRAGHEVEDRHDGVQALAELQSDERPYDLLLTDVVMPGIDGVELARRAGDLRPHMKVVFITGFSGVALNRNRARRALSKPFHLKDLVKQIDSVLTA